MRLTKTLRFILRHPLGRQRPLTALGRFARWQLSSRTGLGSSVVPFVGDAVLVVARGMTGATGNVYVGLHECDDMGFFLHFLRADDLFLDVGANIGSYTVLAASAAGSRCVAVEPVPSTFERLMDNLLINRLSERAEAHRVALGSSRGTLRFSTDLDTMNHVVDESYVGAQQAVPVLTLDELLGERAPIAMKIDVEGFEREVLRGAPRFLSNPNLRAVLMEATDLEARYDAHGDASACSMLEAAGFVPHRYDACARSLSPCTADARSDYGNSLYLRDVEFVRDRLRSAPKFKVGPWQI